MTVLYFVANQLENEIIQKSYENLISLVIHYEICIDFMCVLTQI